MRKIAVGILVSFLVILFAFADDKVELLTTEYEPFCGVKGSTMWCDLVNAALAREGVAVKWTSYPQEREKALVAAGTNVAFLTGTLVVSQEEKPKFIMNDDPLIYASIVAFYPKGKFPAGLGIKEAADLKGKTVGVVRGTGSVSVLQKAGVTIDIANDKDLLFAKLVEGRHDIAVIADLTGLYSLRDQYPGKAGNYTYELVYSSPIDLVFSKANGASVDLKKKYDSGIAKIKADGTFMKIVGKYYPNAKVNKNTLPKDLR